MKSAVIVDGGGGGGAVVDKKTKNEKCTNRTNETFPFESDVGNRTAISISECR